MALAQVVSQAFAGPRRVDGGAVQDEPDRFGAAGDGPAEYILAFALRCGDHAGDHVVDVLEHARRSDFEQFEKQWAGRLQLGGVLQVATPRDVLTAPVRLEDQVEVQPPPGHGAGHVECFWRDVDGRHLGVAPGEHRQ
ncbi:Uncharacterised protein [Mycobacteroides abscessus subsp. abscessus]|nr:Uncharacterised protein [Mycobacteroides abscessus subsp. abscessus]